MIDNENLNPKETLKLVGYDKKFNFIKSLFLKNNLPKVILFSGEKGIGKSTFVSHLMHFFFDKANYDLERKIIVKKDMFHNQYTKNLFPNIYYLDNSNMQNIKIDDMRKLKNDLSKTSLNKNKTFIIMDNVESFNQKSLNAILKIIEEPGTNNHFFLIYNHTNLLPETIKSRCLEIKILLSKITKIEIIDFLIKQLNCKVTINKNLINLSPGLFIRINKILNDKNIDVDKNILLNFKKILDLYKKEKKTIYQDLLIFMTHYHFQDRKLKKLISTEKFIEYKYFILENINDFFRFNFNQNTLLNCIEKKFINE